jgi:hypothetical protein
MRSAPAYRRRALLRAFEYEKGDRHTLLEAVFYIHFGNPQLIFLFGRGALFPYIIGKRANKFASAS